MLWCLMIVLLLVPSITGILVEMIPVSESSLNSSFQPIVSGCMSFNPKVILWFLKISHILCVKPRH
jgi:hypothetical protein